MSFLLYLYCIKYDRQQQLTLIITIKYTQESRNMFSYPTTKLLPLILLLIIAIASVSAHTHNRRQIDQKISQTPMTYGSTIRIQAVPFAYYLHSHLVNYPLGSGQQSVTGFPMDNDYNSLWTIKEPHHEQIKTYRDQVKCGDVIRLEHALTKKNLHSEQIFQSLITKNQQVSAYGHEGNGNENDNWMIRCLMKSEGDVFNGGDHFELVHENTDKMLKMSKYYQYSYANWENCPFQGQIEVSATDKPTKQTQFKIVGGVFFKESSQQSNGGQNENEQL